MVVVRLEQRTAKCEETLLEADGDVWEVEELAEAVIALFEGVPRGLEVRVDLGRSVAQARRLKEVPPVREEKLAALFALQANRLFRRSRDPLTINGAWIDRGAGEAIACAAPEGWLEAVTEAVESTGRRIGSFRVGDCAGGPELIPPSVARRRARSQRRMAVLGVCGVTLVWLLAGVAYAVDLIRDDRMLTNELVAMEAPLLELRRAGESLAAVDSMARLLGPLREKRWSVIQSWVRITEILPPDVTLESLVLDRSGRHSLTGRGVDPSPIMELVRGHPWLSLANPDTEPATVDSTSGVFTVTFSERFHDRP